MNTEKNAWVASLVARYELPLISYSKKIVHEHELAQEVVQETFLRLCREEREKIEDHIAQWLFTVCRNCSIKLLHKYKRMVYVEDLTIWQVEDGITAGMYNSEAVASPVEILAHKEKIESMLEYLKELNKNQQEVIRLRFQSSLSYAEISKVTGLSAGNVGFILNKSMSILRDKLTAKDKNESLIELRNFPTGV